MVKIVVQMGPIEDPAIIVWGPKISTAFFTGGRVYRIKIEHLRIKKESKRAEPVVFGPNMIHLRQVKTALVSEKKGLHIGWS